MKHNPCHWRHDNLRGWSPQRLAAAKRAVAKEATRVEAKREEVALFPDLQLEIQPAYETVEERQRDMDKREIYLTITFRKRRADSWRVARRLFYLLPKLTRKGALRLWNVGIYPADPSYFHEFIRSFFNKGVSPWTYLRKRRLCWLWARGSMPKPDHFLVITSSFNTLGPYPVRRLRDQTLHQIHRLQTPTI